MKWKLATVKGIVRGVVGVSVSYVISNAIKKLEDDNMSTMQKAFGAIGGLAIAWYVTDKVGEYSETVVDEVVEAIGLQEPTELIEEKEA